MAAVGLTPDEFLDTYSQIIRIVPTRLLPWHGRTPRRPDPEWTDQRRLAAAVHRVAASVRAPRQRLVVSAA
jgi:hypothetical protein